MTDLNALPRKVEGQVLPFPAYQARDLTEGGDQARIVLDSQVYNLRITRAGKLILTK